MRKSQRKNVTSSERTESLRYVGEGWREGERWREGEGGREEGRGEERGRGGR